MEGFFVVVSFFCQNPRFEIFDSIAFKTFLGIYFSVQGFLGGFFGSPRDFLEF